MQIPKPCVMYETFKNSERGMLIVSENALQYTSPYSNAFVIFCPVPCCALLAPCLSSDSNDMGFSSVCCEYHWLIKELLWAYSRTIGEQSQVGKTKLNAGRNEVEPEKIQVVMEESYPVTTATWGYTD